MKAVLLTLLAAASLSACVVQPARVRVRSPVVLEPAVVVEPEHSRHHDDDGDFCPPGQARKGRC